MTKVLVPHYLLISKHFDTMGSSPVVMIYKVKILGVRKEKGAGAGKEKVGRDAMAQC